MICFFSLKIVVGVRLVLLCVDKFCFDEDDLEYDSSFMNDFRGKIKKIAKAVKK